MNSEQALDFKNKSNKCVYLHVSQWEDLRSDSSFSSRVQSVYVPKFYVGLSTEILIIVIDIIDLSKVETLLQSLPLLSC